MDIHFSGLGISGLFVVIIRFINETKHFLFSTTRIVLLEEYMIGS